MSMMKQLVAELNETYQEMSESKMKLLCDYAKVDYLKHNEAPDLLRELYKNGFMVRVAPYSNPKAVGQFLILRDLNQKFVMGFEIYIHFDDYAVKSRMVEHEGDIKISVKVVH